MWRIPPAPPGFFRLGESLHSVEVMGVYFPTLTLDDLVHGQEKHRAGAAENLGCRTYGEPSLWVFFPPSHLIN